MRKLLALLALLPSLALATVTGTVSATGLYPCLGGTTYTIPFKYLDKSHIVTTITSPAGSTSILAQTTDYTVTAPGASGTVTLVNSGKCPTGYALKITRATPQTQPVSLRAQGTFSPTTHENALDRLTLETQEETTARLADKSAQQAKDALQDSTFSPAGVAHNAGWINPLESPHGAACSGASDDAPALASASGAAGTTATLEITCSLHLKTSAGTIAAHLDFKRGGQLVLDSGGSVTLTGALTAPLSQVFALGTASDFSGLTFQAKVSEVNPLWWGADPSGVGDSTGAIQAALTANLNVSFPPGTYLVSQITPRTGQRIVGASRYASIIKASNSSLSPILIDRDVGATTGYSVSIEHLRVRGQGDGVGTGHGIESTSNNQGASGLRLVDLWIDQLGGDGVHLAQTWASHIESVWVDLVGGDGFYIGKSFNATTIRNCYAKSIGATGHAGFRLLDGFFTIDTVNGIDRGQFPLILGANVADGDATNGIAHATIRGSNFEDATDTGITIHNASDYNVDGTNIVAPVTGTVRALRSLVTSQNSTSWWGPGNSVSTKGAVWLNGQPIHSKSITPFLRVGKGTDFVSYYYETGAYNSGIPVMMGVIADPAIRLRGGLIVSPDESTGQVVRRFLSATAALDFADTVSGSSADLTITVTGAAVSDTVTLGIPATVISGLGAGAFGWYAWVSATDTVSIRFWNASGANKNPGGGTYRVDCWQH